MSTVYVLSKDGRPLMPTTRCGHVRFLLKQEKAQVVERKPFTIQLLYATPDIVQPLYLGIDPGRTNIGVSVVTENGKCVFSAQLETRNKEVPKLMAERKQHRQKHRKHKRREKRRRRARAAGTVVQNNQISRILPGYEKPVICKDIRNKEARFNNRRIPNGWLTPTARHLLLTHLNLVRKLQNFLPITDVCMELNRFDFMAMDNPHVRKWEYQRGPLYQQGSVEQAVYAQQGGCCLFCKSPIEHYHHVVPRSKGGSETLENRVGLCVIHHRLVHTDSQWECKLRTEKTGTNKKYHALSVLNQIIPFLFKELNQMFPDAVYAVDGRDTKAYREKHKVHKDHHLDAFCIAALVLDVQNPRYKTEVYQYKQFRRHDRQVCHKENCKRVYIQDGNPVAINRHKAIEQKQDSLEEYRLSHTEEEISRLCVKPHHPEYKNLHRVLPGAVMAHNGQMDILFGTTGTEKSKTGRVPSYCVFLYGRKERYRKCSVLLHNQGLCCL